MGEEHGGLSLDLRVLGRGGLDLGLQLADELLALFLQAQALAVELDHLPPGGAPRGLGVGDDGRDLAEGVVLLLGQAGVAGQDDVGGGVGHGLEVDAIGLVEQHGGLGVEFLQLLLHPGQDAVVVVVAEVGGGHTDGDHAQCEGDLVVGPGDGGDALGLGLDGGGAQGVLDGDRRPVPGGLGLLVGGVRGAGHESDRQQRGRGESGRPCHVAHGVLSVVGRGMPPESAQPALERMAHRFDAATFGEVMGTRRGRPLGARTEDHPER